MHDTPNEDTTVRSVRRALGILRSFKVSDRTLALGEIAHRAQLDKATARRLLRTLMAEHLIEQNGATKAYSLGLGVLELAAGVIPCEDLRRHAQPVLVALAETTGAGAFLGVVHDDTALCIGCADGTRATRIRAWSIGARMPLNVGAGPLVLMAHLPLEQRMRVLSQPLLALTPASQTDPFTLATVLETIRLTGWVVAVDDVVDGLAALAVPVHDAAGRVVAAVSIAGPRGQMLDGDAPRHLSTLRTRVAALERSVSGQRHGSSRR